MLEKRIITRFFSIFLFYFKSRMFLPFSAFSVTIHIWRYSSAGRASAWRVEGRRFESCCLHLLKTLVYTRNPCIYQGFCFILSSLLPGIKAITYRNNLEIYVIFSDTNKQSTIISTLLWITVNLSINHVTWMTAFWNLFFRNCYNNSHDCC